MKPHIPVRPSHPERKRRAAWRQRLVEAERGMTSGFRSDSTFFVHFFTGSIIIAAGFVLGLGLLQWAVLVLAFTLVLAAEMFNQVIKILWETRLGREDEATQKALRIGTAAVVVTIAGTLIVVALLFGQRLVALFAQ